MPLSDEEIQRITRSVIERLGGQTQTASVAEPSATGTSETTDSPAPPSPPVDESHGPTPMMTAAGVHRDAHPEFEPTKSDRNRVIVATFGRNRPGVAAALTGVLAEHNCNIADITQKILQEFFSMIMIVDISECTIDFAALREKFRDIESRLGVTIVAQHEDVFHAMHRI